MKIIHIGDIHLGCTLENFRRNREIESVFHFIIETVQENKVEAALLAGDIFDSGSPSNESQEMYFDFLLDLQKAGCRQVILIAGNHDNPNFLDAPQGLLKRMNIHVVGNVFPDDLSREIIPLGNPEEPAGYVCAVPYLWERFVRSLCPEGESGDDRKKAVARGIEEHYGKVFEIADRLRAGRAIPVIGMGHLYAAGSTFGSGDSREPVGSLYPVNLEQCASGFAYMALGHLHRPQTVGNRENWRYAGSILPMDLREKPFHPQIVLLDTASPEHPEVREIPQDCFHAMSVITGNMDELREKMTAFCATGTSVWVKPVYTGTEVLPNWFIDLRQEFRDSPVQILMPEVRRANLPGKTEELSDEPKATLAEMRPEEVFLAHLDKTGEVTDPAQREIFLNLYRQSQQKVYDPSARQENKGRTENAGILRFRRLFIRNVNSLYGDHLIDFDAPEFGKGIFLISGNTGSGKSSILDAICLALYGCTPRLGKITNTKDGAMSQGMNELIAELTFTIGEDSYRAHFLHARTKNGTFNEAKHQLFRNGQAVSKTATDAKNEILQLIGMNVQQFSRCVLLAQGNFDAFLKADPKERSQILKSIAGTELYTQIGTQINSDFMAVKNECAMKKQELDGIQFFTDEKLAEIRKNREEAAENLKKTEKGLVICETNETLFQGVEQSREALKNAEVLAEQARKRQEEAEPERQELKDANRAQNCQIPWQRRQEKRKEAETLRKNLETLLKKGTELELRNKEAAERKTLQESQLSSVLQKQAEAAKLFQEVRDLDSRIKEQKKQTAQTASDLESAMKNMAQAQKKFREAEKKWTIARTAASSAEEYLKNHPGDETLAEKAALWELRRVQLVKKEEENAAEEKNIQNLSNQCRKSEKALSDWKEKLQKTENALQTQIQKITGEQTVLEGLLDGKTVQELQMAYAAAEKLSVFFRDSARRKEYLSPGKPCPLCGSLNHPYCEGTPVPDSGEFSKTAEFLKKRMEDAGSCQERIAAAEQEKTHLTLCFTEEKAKVGAAEEKLQSELQSLSVRKNVWEENCRKTAEEASALAGEFLQALQAEWQDHSALPAELEQRMKAYTEAKRSTDVLVEEQNRYEKARSIFDDVSVQNRELIRKAEEASRFAGETLKNSLLAREKRFGQKNVDEEESRLNSEVDSVRQTKEQAVAEAVRMEEALRHNQQELKTVLADSEVLQPELKEAEQIFTEALHQSGFASEEDFSLRCRDPQKIQELDEKLKRTDEEVKVAQAALEERKKILAEQTAKIPENLDRNSNLEKRMRLQESKEQFQRVFSESELSLRTDAESRKKHESARKVLAELGILLNQWKFLDDHFGTTKNKDNFGIIAQGYTIRELLQYANNNRLQSLKGHFTLVSGTEDPLELDVIDHYRGDQIRTTRNLSGGESFEVSLALALGLSEMSAMSQNARLGNVLLDEGFGTLDEKALDSALELLMQLRSSDGKLVGIISHVDKLRDRIEAKIEVSNSSGIGILSGAGVCSGEAVQQFLAEIHPGRKRAGTKKG